MKIHIPEPCNENWNKMTPTEKGRFCGSCEKEVVDFTSMSKNEIQEYFIQKTTEVTCGRIQNRQLVDLNKEENTNSRFNPKPWWIAAATFLFMAKPGFSQGKPYVKPITHIESKQDSIRKAIPVAMEAPQKKDNEDLVLAKAAKDSSIIVTGYTLDENGDSLPFVNIRIVGTQLGAASDINGKFELIIPPEHQDSLKLKATYIGYEEIQTKPVSLKKDTNLGVIQFTEQEILVLGGAIMYSYSTECYKPTFFGRIKGFFWRLFH